jgi:hypothetical protein
MSVSVEVVGAQQRVSQAHRPDWPHNYLEDSSKKTSILFSIPKFLFHAIRTHVACPARRTEMLHE